MTIGKEELDQATWAVFPTENSDRRHALDWLGEQGIDLDAFDD
jgi:hypothetical protein